MVLYFCVISLRVEGGSKARRGGGERKLRDFEAFLRYCVVVFLCDFALR